MQENHFIQWARRVTYYLRESLCRREEELSAPRISLFCFVSVSLLDVFLFGGGFVFVCFVLLSEDMPLFAFHLFSYQLIIVDRFTSFHLFIDWSGT